MMQSATLVPRIRKAGYIILGILTLAVFAATLVEAWLYFTSDKMQAFGSVQATTLGMPPVDERGAFVLLNPEHRPEYAGNLVELLATTEPGVVDETTGAHFLPSELKAIIVQTAAIGSNSDYRFYRVGDPNPINLQFAPQPGGKDLLITPSSGTWEPGPYLLDLPAEGMFGERNYYQFYIDQAK